MESGWIFFFFFLPGILWTVGLDVLTVGTSNGKLIYFRFYLEEKRCRSLTKQKTSPFKNEEMGHALTLPFAIVVEIIIFLKKKKANNGRKI